MTLLLVGRAVEAENAPRDYESSRIFQAGECGSLWRRVWLSHVSTLVLVLGGSSNTEFRPGYHMQLCNATTDILSLFLVLYLSLGHYRISE